MDTLGQSSLLVAVTSFALGFSVLARNVKNILFIAFAMLTTLVSAWALSFFLEKIWSHTGFYRFHLFFNVLLAPASLILIKVMVRIRDQASRRLLYFSLLMAVCLSIAILCHWETIPLVRQLIYFSPALVVLQTLQLMWIDRRLKKGLKRLPKMPTVGVGKRHLIYFGALLVLGTCVMDHVPWMGTALPSFGNLALVVYLFFLSQAITQQRFLNISALTSRFIVLLVVALTLTGVYSLLVAWIENSPGLFFLNSFIVSFLLLMLLDPLRTIVGYFTQILLTKKHRKLEQTLREAQRKLTGIVDLGTLFHAVLQTSEQTLSPQWAALFVLRSDGTRFRRVRVAGRESDLDPHMSSSPAFRELLANHPLVQYCQELAKKGKFPVLLDQILENEIDRSASKVLREQYTRLIEGMKAMGVNLIIPLIDAGKMLGFVVLKAPSPPEPWGNNWGLLPIIYPYFQQVAQTMQSMAVYVKQKDKERLATLGEMAAGLAHEIRNPLGAIKGAVQFLDPTADRPDSKFLQVILEEVERLNRVVTQFLDYSKPPTGELQLIDLSKIAEKTIELMKPGILKGIEIEFMPSRTPATVMASAEQIRQVLINIIQNAQQALQGKGGGTQSGTSNNAGGPSATHGMIRVTVSIEGENPYHEVVLAVEDTGCGIKKEHIDKLFIPFFTTSPGGTGLGLSISHKIIEAHRGRIEVLSEEERFTRISVILPLAKE